MTTAKLCESPAGAAWAFPSPTRSLNRKKSGGQLPPSPWWTWTGKSGGDGDGNEDPHSFSAASSWSQKAENGDDSTVGCYPSGTKVYNIFLGSVKGREVGDPGEVVGWRRIKSFHSPAAPQCSQAVAAAAAVSFPRQQLVPLPGISFLP